MRDQPTAPVPTSPNQPGDTVNVPAVKSSQTGQAPDSHGGSQYTFKATVEEVHLHATVVDDRQRWSPPRQDRLHGLRKRPAPADQTFQHEDIPVALGVVIDNSGSMRDKRPSVNKAAINLVKASNPERRSFPGQLQ